MKNPQRKAIMLCTADFFMAAKKRQPFEMLSQALTAFLRKSGTKKFFF